MTALTVRLPNSIHAKIRELAARDEISINQFLASAAAEKLASILTEEYLRNDAALGHREAFEKYLAAVPDVPELAADSEETGD